MPGSLTQAAPAWPKPPEIVARALLATALALALVHAFGQPLARSLLPVFRAEVPLLDARFAITDVRLAGDGADQVVRFRGNLSRPLLIRDRIVYPFGWLAQPAGGFQINYAIGGVTEYGAVLLIFVLAWPASRLRELGYRLALALACMAVLPLVIVPLTVVAEFRHGLESLVAPGPAGPALIASRYLMGGGGWVIALLAAVCCIDCASRLAPPPARLPT